MVRFGICMLLVTGCFAIDLFSGIANAQLQEGKKKATAKVTVAGPLAEKLPPETIVAFSASMQYQSFKYSDLPAQLPIDFLTGSYLNVAFYPNQEAFDSPEKERHCLFKLFLSHQPVAESGPTVLSLSAPQPALRSFCLSEYVLLKLPINKHQSYSKLPYWNEKLNKLTSPAPAPRWRIENKGKKLIQGKMEYPECKLGWEKDLPVLDLSCEPPLKCTVSFDTGMAFEKELPPISIDVFPGRLIKQPKVSPKKPKLSQDEGE